MSNYADRLAKLLSKNAAIPIHSGQSPQIQIAHFERQRRAEATIQPKHGKSARK